MFFRFVFTQNKLYVAPNPFALSVLIGGLMWFAFFYVYVQSTLLTAVSFFVSLIIMVAILIYCAGAALERRALYGR